MLAKTEAKARQRLQDLRTTLAKPSDAREVFEALFLPEGLVCAEGWNTNRNRRVWAVSATAHPVRSILRSDPTVAFLKLDRPLPASLVAERR